MGVRVKAPARLRGRIRVPGDKSISHRALILNAVADGAANVSNLSTGADVASTAACLAQLGVELAGGVIQGRGLDGLRAAAEPLDCGNSGTTMRLLAGLLASRPFESVLVGDESLSRRPMDRVVQPLEALGWRAEAGPPLRVGGGGRSAGGRVELAVASAQVKSAVLLAALAADGPTTVVEPMATRDHTERMLRAMGARIEVDGLAVTLRPGPLRAVDVDVPGDLSAAAFWLVAAVIHPDADLMLPGVGVNPSRAAVLELVPGVERAERLAAGEPVADLRARSASLSTLTVDAALAARVIDELPVLAVLAAAAPGRSRFTGAQELRVKESDRIATMAAGLAAMGAAVEQLPDGWVIEGGRPLRGARVDSCGDHRVAMALAVAALVADGETLIEGADAVAISYPGFWSDLEAVCRA